MPGDKPLQRALEPQKLEEMSVATTWHECQASPAPIPDSLDRASRYNRLEVTPVGFKDGAKAALMEPFEELQVTSISDPHDSEPYRRG